MNPQSLYAFYGSLRRGMSNFQIYQEGFKYLFSARLKGFQLFSMGDYPCAVETDTADSIVVEVHEIIDPAIEREIHEMELSVGYLFKNVRIDGQWVGIYLYPDAKNYPQVTDGDWVKFFRENRNP